MAKKNVNTSRSKDFARFIIEHSTDFREMTDSVIEAGDPTLARDNLLSLMYCCFSAGVNTELAKKTDRRKSDT